MKFIPKVGNRVGKLNDKNKKGFRRLSKSLNLLAGVTRLELATSGLTGRRSNQTELHPQVIDNLIRVSTQLRDLPVVTDGTL